MKTYIRFFKALFVFMISAAHIHAQCPDDNTQFGTSAAPTTVGSLVSLTTCLYGGEYRLVTNLQAGSIYSFETCGDTDFDTQVTLYDNTTGAVVGFNDDFCGLQSKVSFTSNGNSVKVLVDKFNCSNQSTCMSLAVTRVTATPVVTPCTNISPLNCGVAGSFSITAAGTWDNLGGPWGTPGAEQVFSFTPTLSGPHDIVVNHNSTYYIDLFIKSGSCSSTGWTYLDDVLATSTNSSNLVAGVTYYILIDDENTTTSNGTVTITCPQPVADPCTSIASLTCGVNSSFSLSAGNGAWNPTGPWGTPGNEAVFEYTAPFTGSYDISVTNSGYYVDLFIKSGSCSSTGWTFLDDVFTTATNTVSMTAGTTYYILVDDENTDASSGTVSISCPCYPPPNGTDGSYVYNGPLTISGTTIGACDDCNLRSSADRVYEIDIACAGSYTFTTCSGTSWDTYLYLRTAACGGSLVALNDDACSLQSSITTALTPGVYYIHVEGFSSLTGGAFDLGISGTLDAPVIGAVTGPAQVCENAVGVGFSVSGNFTTYTWTVPTDATVVSGANTGAIVVNFGATSGSVDVIASNNCGTNSASGQVVVKPTPDFGETVQNASCFGGADGSITLNPTVGDAPFTYYLDTTSSLINQFDQLSAGSYSMSIMDGNGCLSANQSIAVGEPTLLEAQIDGCSSVYQNQGNNYACATINASGTGGTPSYTYLWSNGETTASIVVCPDTTESFNVSITDANGCSASSSFVVNYVDITCTPGTQSSSSSNNPSPPACNNSVTITTNNWVSQPSRVVNAGQVLCVNGSGTYYGSIQVRSGGHLVVCGNITLYGSLMVNPGGNYWRSPNTGFIGSLAVYGNHIVGAYVCAASSSSSSSSTVYPLSSGISYPSPTSCPSANSVSSVSSSGSGSSSSAAPVPPACSQSVILTTNNWVSQPSRVVSAGQVLCVNGSGTYYGSIHVLNGGHLVVCGNSTLYGSVTISNGATYWHDVSTGFVGSLAVYGNEIVGQSVCGTGCYAISYSSSSSSSSSNSSSNSSSSSSSLSCSSHSNTNQNAGNATVQMCFNGVTYCIQSSKINNRILCGYSLGPCNAQDSSCAVPASNPSAQVCACTAQMTNIRLRYIGPSFSNVTATAKRNCVTIDDYTNLMTGDYFNIIAANGGLAYLKKNTYVGVNGRLLNKVKIPTNCCETVVGNVYYPFEIVGWADADGNTCGNVGITNLRTNQTAATQIEKEDAAMIRQFPNPAENISTFEFEVANDGEVDMSIVNVRGQIIATIFSGQAEADKTYQFTQDVADLQSGIYFIYLNTSEGVFKKKFVILK